jgi:hypothetical protein
MAFPTTLNPSFLWNAEGFSFQNLKMLRDASAFGPAVVYAKIAPDASGNNPFAQGPTRGIIADVAGTMTGHDAFGNLVTGMPLQPGYNPISMGGITSIATTTQVWGVW